MRLDLIIQIHYMKYIQKLAFIFVKPLHLHVKDRSRIHFDSVMLLNVFCQTFFVLILDIHELLKRRLVICILLKP